MAKRDGAKKRDSSARTERIRQGNLYFLKLAIPFSAINL